MDELLTSLDVAAPTRWVHGATRADLSDAMEIGEALVRHAPRAVRPPSTCLYRALARYAVSHEAGLHPTFVIGVRPDAATLEDDAALGHAWIEIDGAPAPPELLAPHVVSLRHARQRSVS